MLHVIIDPLCGWCYASAPLLNEAQKHIDVKLHAGGLFIGNNRRPITPEFRDYVLPNDKRIQALTGQSFGTEYTDGLLLDTNVVIDSEPPITALLAIEALGGNSLQLLHDMQVAYYQQGKWLSDRENLIQIAEQQGIEAKAFNEAFENAKNKFNTHIVNSRQLLSQIGGQGYPTFALQTAEGDYIRLNHSDYYGQVDSWLTYLENQINKIN